MTIKQQGGIFGRNPTFNLLTAGTGSAIEGSGDNVTFSVNRTDASTAGALVFRAANGNLTIDSDGADKDILIRTGGGIERARFYGDSGNFSITGNLIVDSGNGIDFSATSGTGTSELFSDYEEGSWTPALVSYSGTPTVEGYYVKIGKMVFLECKIILDGISDASSYIVDSLPFSIASPQFGGGSVTVYDGGVSDIIVGVDTSSRLRLRNSSAASLNYTTVGASSTIGLNIQYRAA